MSNLDYFLLTLLFFAATNGLEVIGFDIEFGQVGVVNLAYIVFVAVGAYATGIASVAPAAKLGTAATSYIGGMQWGFPLNLLFGVAVTVIVAWILSSVAFRRLRHDYLALVLVAIGEAALLLATNETSLVNGESGISGVVGPLQNSLSPAMWNVLMDVIALAALALTYVAFWRIYRSPLGRLFKAVREDELLVNSLGKSATHFKRTAFLLGAGAGGLAGGLLILYIGGWSVGGWQPGETFVILAALVLGGRGRLSGALLGSFILMVVFLQGSTFLKLPVAPGVVPAVQQLIVACVLLAVLWWRPRGLFPERKERFPTRADSALERLGPALAASPADQSGVLAVPSLLASDERADEGR